MGQVPKLTWKVRRRSVGWLVHLQRSGKTRVRWRIPGIKHHKASGMQMVAGVCNGPMSRCPGLYKELWNWWRDPIRPWVLLPLWGITTQIKLLSSSTGMTRCLPAWRVADVPAWAALFVIRSSRSVRLMAGWLKSVLSQTKKSQLAPGACKGMIWGDPWSMVQNYPQ